MGEYSDEITVDQEQYWKLVDIEKKWNELFPDQLPESLTVIYNHEYNDLVADSTFLKYLEEKGVYCWPEYEQAYKEACNELYN